MAVAALWIVLVHNSIRDLALMKPTTPSTSQRILELDALRGLAALAVVLFHYTTRYDQLFGYAEPLAVAVPWGHFGVDLFFMLSGFVILMSLERTSSAWKFAWGRFSRLYPAYWASAALTFAVVSLSKLPGHEVSLGEALLNLTMVQALLGAPHIDGAYWSLQAELIFYANILLLFYWGAFRRPTLTVAVWLAMAVAVRLAGGIVAADWPWAGELLSKVATVASLKYIPLFAIGMLFYKCRQSGSVSKEAIAVFVACWATILLFNGFTTAIIDALLGAILLLAVHSRLRFLSCRPLVALGAVSYTLYLVHQNIGYALIRQLQLWGVTPWLAIAGATLFSIMLASWLHRLVELRAMKSLRNLDPARHLAWWPAPHSNS